MDNLQVQIEPRDGVVVVRLSGDGGTSGTNCLQSALPRVAALRPALIIFDLADVVFVASLFMGVMVGFRHDVLREGGEVRLAALQPNVENAFRTARLTELFPITSSVDEALALRD